MKTKPKNYIGALLSMMAGIFLLSSGALAQDVTGPVPWVSSIDGPEDALLIRQPDTDWFEATENTPIGEGDMLWQGGQGRSEVFIDRGKYVRLDRESAVVFDRLTDEEVRLVVTRGEVEVRNSGGSMLVDLPGQTIVVPAHTRARVRVNEDGSSDVTVRDGQARVEGPNGTVKVKAGNRLSSDPEGRIGGLSRSDRGNDFDRWSDDRDRELSLASGPPATVVSYLPEPTLYRMHRHGAWVNDPYYGWVWRPTVSAGWAPYRVGRWVYRLAWGWTWVSYEPWGWHPYHYGRWVTVGGAWAWTPVEVRARWSPALVFWIEGPDYIAWHPLPFGVSLAVVSTWGPDVYSHYIVPGYVTVVSYRHFGYCNYERYARPWPGHCGNGCYVSHRPHRLHSNPRDIAHYRTPRPSGYVTGGRAPRDSVVYAHHRPDGSRGASRVDYGSPDRRGPTHVGRADSRTRPADRTTPRANASPDRGRPYQAGEKTARKTPERTNPDTARSNERPAPGNRANPSVNNGSRGRENGKEAVDNRGGDRGPSRTAPSNTGKDRNRAPEARPAPTNRGDRGAPEARPAPARDNQGREKADRQNPPPRPTRGESYQRNDAAENKPAASDRGSETNRGSGDRSRAKSSNDSRSSSGSSSSGSSRPSSSYRSDRSSGSSSSGSSSGRSSSGRGSSGRSSSGGSSRPR